MYVSGRGNEHCDQYRGWYSLCAEMALNVRGQYRRVLTVYGNGIKRPWSVPAECSGA